MSLSLSHQPPAISHQPPAISHQPSAWLPAISHQPVDTTDELFLTHSPIRNQLPRSTDD